MISLIETLYYFLKFCMMTFTLASLSFTIIGISYSTVRSIVDKENYIYVPDMLNETKKGPLFDPKFIFYIPF